MEVVVTNHQKILQIDVATIKPIVQSVLSLEKVKTDLLFIHFVTPQKITALHKKYFNDSTTTDCITFPIDDVILGEIFINPKAAMNYVKLHGGDVYEEVVLYLVHGLLHLCGYDDLDEAEEKRMREAEKRHLKQLRLK